jgi:hypothetical protein
MSPKNRKESEPTSSAQKREKTKRQKNREKSRLSFFPKNEKISEPSGTNPILR